MLTEFWWTESEASVYHSWTGDGENGSERGIEEAEGGDEAFTQASQGCLSRKRWSYRSIAKTAY